MLRDEGRKKRGGMRMERRERDEGEKKRGWEEERDEGGKKRGGMRVG